MLGYIKKSDVLDLIDEKVDQLLLERQTLLEDILQNTKELDISSGGIHYLISLKNEIREK